MYADKIAAMLHNQRSRSLPGPCTATKLIAKCQWEDKSHSKSHNSSSLVIVITKFMDHTNISQLDKENVSLMRRRETTKEETLFANSQLISIDNHWESRTWFDAEYICLRILNFLVCMLRYGLIAININCETFDVFIHALFIAN